MAGASPVRWGVLGTGRINRKLLEGARESDQVEVVAVGSRDRERAAEFAAEQGIGRAYGSYEELLADPDVEAVYIPLPNSMHHPWTLRALGAGKHVLCEKPYTRRSAEAVEAFDLAEASGLVLSEGFMWRHGPQTRRLVELLPELGRIEAIRATFGYSLEDDTDIRMLADLDGGALMDVGCYCVSGARLIAGEEPDSVYGEAVFSETGVDTRFTGTLHFPTGVIAEFTASFRAPHMSLEAIGTKGSVSLPDPWHSKAGILYRDGEEIRVDPTHPYRLELEDVGRAIRGEAPPLLGRDDAVGQAKTIEALYRSAEIGAPVSP